MWPTCRLLHRLARCVSVISPQCRIGWKELDTYSRLDGEEAVIISVRKQSGTNTVQVAELVHNELQALAEARPDLNLSIVQDQSTLVEESFNDAMRELLIGALMASLVVLFFFRNLRNTLVTARACPIILLGTFGVMSALNMTLNIVSLLALTLSVGLIIDDAIVVRENIFRHMEMGKSPKQASSDGTAEVAMPVLAMSLTIVAVFLPIAFVGGLIGKFLNSFGVVVSVAVLISLFRGTDLCAHAVGLSLQTTEGQVHSRRGRSAGNHPRQPRLARSPVPEDPGLDAASSTHHHCHRKPLLSWPASGFVRDLDSGLYTGDRPGVSEHGFGACLLALHYHD